MNTKEKIGFLLKEKRIEKNYSLQRVGDMIGRTKSSIHYYETGKRSIDIDVLEAICNVYGIDMYDFLDQVRKL